MSRENEPRSEQENIAKVWQCLLEEKRVLNQSNAYENLLGLYYNLTDKDIKSKLQLVVQSPPIPNIESLVREDEFLSSGIVTLSKDKAPLVGVGLVYNETFLMPFKKGKALSKRIGYESLSAIAYPDRSLHIIYAQHEILEDQRETRRSQPEKLSEPEWQQEGKAFEVISAMYDKHPAK